MMLLATLLNPVVMSLATLLIQVVIEADDELIVQPKRKRQKTTA
jgi:hypothetical protein